MKVDKSRSIYRERPDARTEFSTQEMRHARQLLRRLQFLEHQIREKGGLANGGDSGGASFAEWECAALEWILDDIGFLEERKGA